MHKLLKQIAAAVSVGIFLGVPVASAMPDILPVSEIAQGMDGTAYTVVDSSGDIASFDVHVIGILQNGKGSFPKILAKASGPIVETAGGILQGMSGSPIYVDGQLVGAAAATYKDMDAYTFLITPIEDMLPIWDMPDTKNQTHVQVIDIKKAEADREKVKADLAAKEKAKQEKAAKAEGKDAVKAGTDDQAARDADKAKSGAADGKEEAKPEAAAKEPAADAAAKGDAAAEEKKPAETARKPAGPTHALPSVGREPEYKTTLYATGFGDAGFRYLSQKLAPLGIKASPTLGSSSSDDVNTDYDAVLEPGSPVGVVVAYGDFTLGATGTVTAVDDNRILAFGHPFLHRGNVNYFMTDASVVGTVSGQSDGMKLANVGNLIGRVNQDRGTGVAGILGEFPSVVPIRVAVDDKTLERTQTFSVSAAYDEDFLPLLSATISYAALGRTVDNLAESTVKVHFSIGTNAMDGGKVERTNLFYAPADVGQVAFNELGQAMNLICSNTERESDIYDVQVDITSEAERRTASLISAIPDKLKAHAGDTVTFETTIKPYRGDKITLKIPFTVPKTQRVGAMHLDLHGGGLVSVSQLMAAVQEQAGVDLSAEEDKTETTSDKLKKFLETDANNEIVVEPSSSGPLMSEAEQKDAVKQAIQQAEEQAKNETAPKGGKAEKPQPPKTKFATDYVIDNVIHATLQIVKKDE